MRSGDHATCLAGCPHSPTAASRAPFFHQEQAGAQIRFRKTTRSPTGSHGPTRRGKLPLKTFLNQVALAPGRPKVFLATRAPGSCIRLDAGGGSVASLNGLLSRGYAVVSKDYSAQRVSRLVKSVTQWVEDPDQPERQVGWVREESLEYVRPVRRLAVRCKSAKGRWHYGVLLFAGLDHQDILTLMGESLLADEATIMRASLHFYDQRGGGIETSFGEDKSGLGITKRNKKRFEAQRLLMLLGTLAHNLLIWSRRWLCQSSPEQASRLRQYGIKRMIRDLYQISGILSFDKRGRLRAIALQSASSRGFTHACPAASAPRSFLHCR